MLEGLQRAEQAEVVAHKLISCFEKPFKVEIPRDLHHYQYRHQYFS